MSPIVALLTPFDRNGQIDFSAFCSYLTYLRDKGVKSVICNGTTAEFPSLSLDERMKLLEYCRSHFDGCIINHVSACCISDIRRLLDHSQNISDSVLLLPPYYYAKQQEEGVRAFFAAVLSSTTQPLFLYNFPLHTNFEISAALVEGLAKSHQHLVGIKDSSGNLEAASAFSNIRSPFSVYVGSDRLVCDVLQAGLAGSVTGAGNSFPECLVKIHEYFSAGAKTCAREIQELFNRWNTWRKEFDADQLALTKQAVSLRLSCFPINVRPPICPFPGAYLNKITEKVLEFEEELSGLIEKIGEIEQ